MIKTIKSVSLGTEDLSLLKEYCHINHNNDDKLLIHLTLSALAFIEVKLGFALIKRDIRKILYELPLSGYFTIAYKPINYIKNIKVCFKDKIFDIEDVNKYAKIDNDNIISLINIKSLLLHGADFNEIYFDLEIGMSDNLLGLPDNLCQAVMLTASYYYGNRAYENMNFLKTPIAVNEILSSYKNYKI